MVQDLVKLMAEIRKVQELLNQHRDYFGQNEEAVRLAIVNPILGVLGWNTANPAQVKPNLRIQEGIPDYALWKNGKTVLFIEAKKHYTSLDEPRIISQLGNYCYQAGVRYGLLTNGGKWVLFRSFVEDVPPRPKPC